MTGTPPDSRGRHSRPVVRVRTPAVAVGRAANPGIQGVTGPERSMASAVCAIFSSGAILKYQRSSSRTISAIAWRASSDSDHAGSERRSAAS